MFSRLFVLGLSLTIVSAGMVVCASAQDAPALKKISSEYLLPASTKAWVSIPDYSKLKEKFFETELGRLTNDEKFKPFITSLGGQIRNWLNDQNVRLGVKVEDIQAVRTGEICFAGVLREIAGVQEDPLVRGSHGMVLLVDVSKTQEKARELLNKVDADFESRHATNAAMEIHGVKVTKWTIQRPKMHVKTRSTYHAIAGGWMLASDNETIFREIVRRLVSVEKIKPAETLASKKSYLNIAKNTSVKGVKSDIRWFVDPFGYIELAQAIEHQDQRRVKRKDDWARILREEGFDALYGVGGQISFATDEHELLHRTFVYAPRKGVNGENQKRFFGLFDFENKRGTSLAPESWVPTDVSDYLSAKWDMSQALKNVSGLVDSFMKEEGSFDNIMASLKADMNVDVPKLVASFDNKVFVFSATKRPITENSERVAICIPIKEGEKGLLDVIKRALGGEDNFKSIKILGKEVLLVEMVEDEEFVEELQIFEDPSESDDDDEDVNGAIDGEFQLFAQKYFTVAHRHFIICNNKDYLKRIISGKNKQELVNSADYVQVQNALLKLVDTNNVSFRQFGRIDRALETNYEMLRQGKMAKSNTMLARILNRVLTPTEEIDAEGVEPRTQKLDGSKLPEDYAKYVAPYFGPTGWVFETHEEGWRLTGCMLKKNSMNEVVQKPLTRTCR